MAFDCSYAGVTVARNVLYSFGGNYPNYKRYQYLNMAGQTHQPTADPTQATLPPSKAPTTEPSNAPSMAPTVGPSLAPTIEVYVMNTSPDATSQPDADDTDYLRDILVVCVGIALVKNSQRLMKIQIQWLRFNYTKRI
eukprot:1086954_1